MAIYYTRHGQTDWNLDYKIQGRKDIPLNETGRKEAEELRIKIQDIPLDIIYSSPLKRAYETAEIARGNRDIPLLTDNRLAEEYYGQFEGVSRHNEKYKEQRQHFFCRYPGGEGYLDVAYRVYSLLHELEETCPDKNILIVAHGGMSRVVETYFHDLNNEEFVSYMIPNCGLVRYQWPHRIVPLKQ